VSRLTTHVLDTTRGRPAAGVTVVLLRADVEVASLATDADGRADFGEVEPDTYMLMFAMADYFGSAEFLDVVPVRFVVGDGRYHVPLLVSPWSYSTYRGS
jgi:5-hydroxyisourate hydrolase